MFHFLLLWLISAEIIDYCRYQMLFSHRSYQIDFNSIKNVLLSIAWALYSGILLTIGILKNLL